MRIKIFTILFIFCLGCSKTNELVTQNTATGFSENSSSNNLVGNQQVITLPTGGSPATSQALLWLPEDYDTSQKLYPLIIFLGGVGEQGPDIENELNYGTLPYRISEGFAPSAINPVTGNTKDFIVVSPQGPANSWGWQCVPHLSTMLPVIEQTYRVNTRRIYITGLSAGGWGAWSCICDDTDFCKQVTAIVPVSSAAAQNPQNVTNAAKYGVAVWSICGEDDSFYSTAKKYTDQINAENPVIEAKLTGLKDIGHSAWIQAYDSSFRVDGKNIFEWMLQYRK